MYYMTKIVNAYIVISNNTGKLAEAIAKRFPHLKFAVWDLAEFMPFFHNVRRNMRFIECEKVARESVRAFILGEKEFANLIVFDGERRPKSVNEEWAAGRGGIEDVVVIIGRNDFNETEKFEKNGKIFSENVFVPKLERRLVDLLAYAYREWLPFSMGETADVFAGVIRKERENIDFGLLSRYATRRYVAWILNMLLVKLSEKDMLLRSEVDGKILKSGERAWKAIKEVEKL